MEKTNKSIVLKFLQALNEDDFKKARECISDNYSFVGVLGKRDGADEYIRDMEKMRFKYEIKKVFENGDDVCVWYDINMQGEKIPTAGLYHLENDKICSLYVLFDPRPVLKSADKKPMTVNR